MEARAIDDAALDGAEPLLEGLDLAEDALANLVRITGVVEAALRVEGGWRAGLTVEDTELLVVAGAGRWSILAPAGADLGDAMLAARRLHGRLGTAAEGWDLDR